MRLFRKREDQNEKLIRNLNRLNEKEKIEQQEPKVLGQKLVKGKTNKGKEINVYNSQQGESIRSVV